MTLRSTFLLCLLSVLPALFAAEPGDLGHWKDRASRVEIVRDEWGIAHVYGKTDADTVFGALYAQAEDDFHRIEQNYLVGLGWLAQAEGEPAVYSDLRARLFGLTGDIVQPVDDSKPSLAVGMAPAPWGALASFEAWEKQNTKRIYGSGGNSFVAAVEFGPRVRAKAIMAGGESGDPASPHFTDQAQRYVRAEFREVWFYPPDVSAHAQRQYRPGD